MLNIVKFGQRFSTQCRTILLKKSIRLPTQSCGQANKIHFTASHCTKDDDSKSKNDNEITPVIASKYDLFTDDKATVILDIEEERDRLLAGEIEEIEDAVTSIFEGLNTEHGKTGVFDIEDLVAVLKRDNAENIFVCTVPKHLKYVDHLVVITARSHRHMKAIAEFVRKMYKTKRNKGDVIPKIEGKNSEEWMAMDLGNIALHIFSSKVRKQYDLEMLWSVGSEFDTETNKPSDPIYSLFDQHSFIIGEGAPENNTDENISSSSSSSNSSENNVNVDQILQTNDAKIDLETK